MSIAGNLRTLDLSELLQWLSHGRKTGTLVIESGATEKRIYFKQGRIVGSSSSDPDEHLGNFLLREELVDNAMLARAFKLQKATNILLGKVLSTLGVVSSSDLDRVLRSKCEESIYALFEWREGEFRFLRDELPDWPMVPISLDVTNVVLEGMHRLDQQRKLNGGERPEPADGAVSSGTHETALEPAAEAVSESIPEEAVEETPEPAAEAAPEPVPEEPADREVEPVAEAAPEPTVEEPIEETAEPAAERPEPERFQTVYSGAAAAEAPVAPEAAAEEIPEGHPLESPELSGYYQTLPSEKSRRPRLVAMAAVLLLAAGLIASYFLFWRPSLPVADQIAAVEETPVLRIPSGPDDPFSDRQGESSRQIRFPEEPPPIPGEAVEEAATEPQPEEDLEAQLREQYEKEIAALRRQLEEAQLESEEPTPASRPSALDEAEAQAASQERTETLGRESQAPDSAGQAGQRPDQQVTTAGGSTASQASEPRPPSGAEQESGAAAATAPGPATPPAPEIKEGDLISLGPGVMPPQIVKLPRPRYPPAARRLRQRAVVAVKVLVDETGKPIDARLASDPVGMGFDEAAMQAARETVWQPASKNGVKVKIWMDIRIDFRP